MELNCHVSVAMECPYPTPSKKPNLLTWEFRCRTSKRCIVYDEFKESEFGIDAEEEEEEITSSTIRLESSAVSANLGRIDAELARYGIKLSDLEDGGSSFSVSFTIAQPANRVIVNIRKVFESFNHVTKRTEEKETECKKDDNEVIKTCTVCLDKILLGSVELALPCKHVFHGECIVKWLHQSPYCPNCRFEMPGTLS